MRFRPLHLLPVPLLAALAVAAACSNEGEGQPCSIDNGNDDCQDGYACVAPPNKNATNAPYVCCPGAGQPPTTPECTTNGAVDSGSSEPPEGSTMPDTFVPTDGKAGETGAEAAAESSTDSASDHAGDSSSAGEGGGD